MSDPLRSLADAARAVTAAATDEDVLAIVVAAARDVIGARAGVANGSVEVRLRLEGDIVHLTVSDDGPGFEAPTRPLSTPEGPGGWGLYLVDRCAVRWGNERAERHRVWLELERRDAA